MGLVFGAGTTIEVAPPPMRPFRFGVYHRWLLGSYPGENEKMELGIIISF
ncbi:hypothetical protein TanjilG_24111 [Lupinus angustifolius]|uniref:Uncharacterized protein n=1 Tax=Lupinus angustifolius TaxID=3871 RepID=A0A1J7G4K1_LUPAN|nr:hypothetical protein TanjilG_24111 [Lupinus angustifolius]